MATLEIRINKIDEDYRFPRRDFHRCRYFHWVSFVRHRSLNSNEESTGERRCNFEPSVKFRISKIDVVVETSTMVKRFGDDQRHYLNHSFVDVRERWLRLGDSVRLGWLTSKFLLVELSSLMIFSSNDFYSDSTTTFSIFPSVIVDLKIWEMTMLDDVERVLIAPFASPRNDDNIWKATHYFKTMGDSMHWTN